MIPPKLRGHGSDGFFVNAASRRSAQEKRRYGKAKNHQKLRRSGAPTFKPMVGMRDKKARADIEKTHRNAQKAQEAQKKTHRKHRESTNRKEAYGSRNEEERDGQGDKNAVHDETLL